MGNERKNVLEYLPKKIASEIKNKVPDIEQILEIRIRVNKPICVRTIKKEYVIDEIKIENTDMNRIFNIITEFSTYAYENSIKKGFITVKGGHRIGICGEAVYENNEIKYINNVSYLNFRSAKEIFGCANDLYEKIYKNNIFKNTLIISEPGKGKTTLLRDIIRLLSDKGKFNISVIDERSEIAASYKGMTTNDLGIRTDVMTAFEKKDGIVMAIRAMAPDIIAVDEIGNKEDIEGLYFAKQSGVGVIATAHGSNVNEKVTKYKDLFKKYIYIEEIGEYECI